MPRKYMKKKTQKYGEEDLKAALDEVKSGMPVSRASKLHGVPEQTVRNHVLKIVSRVGAGRPKLLTDAEEQELCSAIVFLGKVARPLTRNEIMCVVSEYFSSQGKTNPWTNSTSAGSEWLTGFLKRHASLSLRQAELLTVSRANCATRPVISKWFQVYLNMIQELHIDNYKQILNVDETSFDTSLRAKVVVEKGQREVHQLQPGSGKEAYTVAFTVSGNGEAFPPYVVFKGKNLWSTWCQGGPKGVVYTCSDNGWQDKGTFCSYFEQLVSWTVDWPKPILLLLDGHGSHIQYKIGKLALDNNIHILSFPPHCSHLLQPLDVGVFGPLKKAWLTLKREHGQQSGYSAINKERIPSLLKQLEDSGALPGREFPTNSNRKHNVKKNIISSFVDTGLCPYDPQQVIKKIKPDRLFNEHDASNKPEASTSKVAVTSNEPSTVSVDVASTAIEPVASTAIEPVASTSKEPSPSGSITNILLKHFNSSAQTQVIKPKRFRFGSRVLTEKGCLKELKCAEEKRNKMAKKQAERKGATKGSKKRAKIVDSSDTEDEPCVVDLNISSHSEDDIDLCESDQSTDLTDNVNVDGFVMPKEEMNNVKTGDHVVAIYGSVWYIAKVESVLESHMRLSYMDRKGDNMFLWDLNKPDILETLKEDILLKVNEPVPISSRYLGLSSNDRKQAAHRYYMYCAANKFSVF